MNTAQRIIKYLAIAFGIFLSVCIISAIAISVISVGTVISGIDDSIDFVMKNENNITSDKDEKYFELVKNIDIDISCANLTIEEGEKLKVTATGNLREYTAFQKDNTLYIKDTSKHFFASQKQKINIILTLPKDYQFSNVNIKAGVGESKINMLNTDSITCELGVGDFEFSNVTSDYAQINGGVGEVDIYNSSFGKLNLKGGVGDFLIEANIKDNSKIECGVGDLELNILSDMANYTVVAKTGLGKLTLNGDKISHDATYGNGNIKVEITSGVGDASINFSK